MVDINRLPAIEELTCIETSFRAFAGPGAGKTSWLINHLKRLVKESPRLGLTSKIACITYTNVGADEILRRLDCDKSRIEISTIHGFLYKNIVRPFSYLIEYDDGGQRLFNISEIQGHEEHHPHLEIIRRWIHTIEEANNKNYRYLTNSSNRQVLTDFLANLDYKLDTEGNVELSVRNHRYNLQVPSRNGELWAYKRKYWSAGIMHHEDVLYFANYILQKFPRVVEFIRNKFPYIFVDEFQDTTSLQTVIVKKIGEAKVTLGVIGDVAQSIYKFAGAVRSDFENFDIHGMRSYKLERNYRSTQSIINFLNRLRPDIEQQGYQGTEVGGAITVLLGSHSDCYKWMLENISDSTVVIAREHGVLKQIRSQVRTEGPDLLQEMYVQDQDFKRVKLLHALLLAFRWHEKKNYKEAVFSISRQLKRENPGTSAFQIRKASISLLLQLKDDHAKKGSLYDYYMNTVRFLNDEFGLKAPPKLRSGNAEKFYRSFAIEHILPSIRVETQVGELIRTIHSTKGAEFDNVLVCLNTGRELEKFVFEAATRIHEDADETRVHYVAFSRAKKNLFISVPSCSPITLKKLASWDLKMLSIPVPGLRPGVPHATPLGG